MKKYHRRTRVGIKPTTSCLLDRCHTTSTALIYQLMIDNILLIWFEVENIIYRGVQIKTTSQNNHQQWIGIKPFVIIPTENEYIVLLQIHSG